MMSKCFNGIMLIGLVLLGNCAYAWNALGHRLVAQIAYDHLTPRAKQQFNRINHALDKVYGPKNFVDAATWLDTIHYGEGVNWFNPYHYVNESFSQDGTPLPETQTINAIWAIDKSIKTLESKKTRSFDKGVAFRVLIHVVGDLHQPLHGANNVSRQHPHGDEGGNLFPLAPNSVADNLHWYWDQGAGSFKTTHHVNATQLKQRAHQIEKQWPCKAAQIHQPSRAWLKESHDIAVKMAYQLHPNDRPDKIYQKNAQYIATQRVALAGCRLAEVLNKLAA